MAEKAVKENVDDVSGGDVPAPSGDYEVMYRRYRPETFDSVIGQESVTEPLRRRVLENRVPHAILMAGPRGCGKTTTARILAMALNCDNRSATGDPCGVCNMCEGVLQGRSGTGAVIEIDGATNRSIDSIRQIQSDASVASISSYKVFIIDEVHQITPQAMDAFLKTLEEAPPNVVFVLCTTELDKIKETIRSRSVVFRFRTLANDSLEGLVRKIMSAEGIELSDEDVAQIVADGKGSPRDTISALEMAVDGSVVRASSILPIADAIADENVSAIMISVASVLDSGSRTPSEVLNLLLEYFRDCLLAHQAPDVLRVQGDALEDMKDIASQMGPRKIISALNRLSEASYRVRSASGDGRVILEAALIQSAAPDAKDSVHDVLDLLEEALEKIDELAAQVAELRKASQDAPQKPRDDLDVRRDDDRDVGASDGHLGTENESSSVVESERDDEMDSVDEDPGTSAGQDLSEKESGGDRKPSKKKTVWDGVDPDEAFDLVCSAAGMRASTAIVDVSLDGDDKESWLTIITERSLSDKAFNAIADRVNEKYGVEIEESVNG